MHDTYGGATDHQDVRFYAVKMGDEREASHDDDPDLPWRGARETILTPRYRVLSLAHRGADLTEGNPFEVTGLVVYTWDAELATPSPGCPFATPTEFLEHYLHDAYPTQEELNKAVDRDRHEQTIEGFWRPGFDHPRLAHPDYHALALNRERAERLLRAKYELAPVYEEKPVRSSEGARPKQRPVGYAYAPALICVSYDEQDEDDESLWGPAHSDEWADEILDCALDHYYRILESDRYDAVLYETDGTQVGEACGLKNCRDEGEQVGLALQQLGVKEEDALPLEGAASLQDALTAFATAWEQAQMQE